MLIFGVFNTVDLIIFGCFCIFLLYICCIGVLNATSLATDGTFYGLLPFEAFTGEYIGTTLVLFVLAFVIGYMIFVYSKVL